MTSLWGWDEIDVSYFVHPLGVGTQNVGAPAGGDLTDEPNALGAGGFVHWVRQ